MQRSDYKSLPWNAILFFQIAVDFCDWVAKRQQKYKEIWKCSLKAIQTQNQIQMGFLAHTGFTLALFGLNLVCFQG